LREQPDNKSRLEQWGNCVGASERTLQRLFHKETNLSFQQWRQQLRLQVALQQLIHTDKSVSEIAATIGYDSSSTFIAMFHRQLGVTPGEYVKSLGNKRC